MTEAEDVVAGARAVLVVDWPSREVPETLARAGFDVVVHGGPGPEDYTEYLVENEEIVTRARGGAPDHADVVYAHRPLTELAGIVEMAHELGARAVWIQSGVAAGGAKDPAGCWMDPEESGDARELVESAGLSYVDDTYIVEVARRRRAS